MTPSAGHRLSARGAAIVCVFSLAPIAAAQWTHLAGTPSRVAVTPSPLPSPSTSWIANTDRHGAPITFVGLAGVVTDDTRVYAIGASQGQSFLYAFDKQSGVAAWQAPIAAPVLDSWSSPAVGDVVVVASADTVHAFDPADGTEVWTAGLPDLVVNASPLLTSDRAFITTFAPFGNADLICIDIDTGDVIWHVPIGPAAGATPALADDVVYVATADAPGRILAFDATANDAPPPRWSTPNPQPHGFFSAPCVTESALFAASYSFDAGQFNANLLKLDLDGTVIWSIPTGRTDSTPIPLDGTVILSTGLPGFGALPSIQHITDHGDSATLDWDSALDTWIDANDNGTIDDGEYLSIGGWTHHPIRAGDTLVVGTIGDTFGAYTDMRFVDPTRHPADPDFIIDHVGGTGSTPALDASGLFSIGPGGLHAFLACNADCNADGTLDILDFVCYQQRFLDADPLADCNGDDALNVLDFVCYQQRFQQGCAK